MDLVREFCARTEEGGFTWDLRIPRRIPDRVITEIQRLVEWTEDFDLISEADCLCWLDADTIFSVKNCYQKLLQVRLELFGQNTQKINWGKIWFTGVPSRVDFFVWVLMKLRTHVSQPEKARIISSRKMLLL